MPSTKTCATCGVPKALALFPLRGGTGDYRPHCLECYNGGRRGEVATKAQHAGPHPTPKPVEETLPPVAEHRLKAKNAALEMRIKQLLDDLSSAQRLNDYANDARMMHVEGIKPRERASGAVREATALVLASDWHIEERVMPEQVANRNRYNLEISARRMERFFEATRYGLVFNRQIFKIRDLVLWLGGDFITNYLHEDNVQSNLLSPVEAIAYAHASITAGIHHLLGDPELERIVIPCNDGNHGRLSKRVNASTRIENSLEWLLYKMIAEGFKDEPRVQFLIPESVQTFLEIYGRTVRFTHGDSVNYQGGVGGVTIPIYKALGRWDTVRRADLTCMGHFHQLTSLSDLIINGSLIGYNPYAMSIGARFEPPAQAMTILDPLRFKSISMPLWVSEREDDKAAHGIKPRKAA